MDDEKYPIMSTPWIQTYRNIKFDPYHATIDDLDILDIAHALSNTCRWGGHCKQFYSVAQHAVTVMTFVPKPHKLAALLHDSAEAYIGDMPSPIKATLPDFKYAERCINELIEDKWGVDIHHQAVKEADRMICKWEAYNLLDNSIVEEWAGENPLRNYYMFAMKPETAKTTFLYWYNVLTNSSAGEVNALSN